MDEYKRDEEGNAGESSRIPDLWLTLHETVVNINPLAWMANASAW
jgi:hypothetical protein